MLLGTSEKVLWDNGFYSTISGQPYQLQLYGPPRADERLQMATDVNEGSGYVCVVVILFDCHQKLTFEMITLDRRRNS